MWLGTDLVFDAFKFYIEQTPYGVMQVHGYPYDATGSTFIVEMHDSVWRAAGFDRLASPDLPPGARPTRRRSSGSASCSPHVLDGHAVHANNSKWISFGTLRCESWRHGNVILLGDAAHTAHFSIGSGTKLAMEDALALAACLHEQPGLDAALAAYEAERRPVVASTQRAAQASLEWFENLGQYLHQEPEQFAFNIMTRSRRVTHGNLRVRDPEFADADRCLVRRPREAARLRPGRRGPADVPAAAAARPGAEEPGRGVGDGHVLRGRRHARPTSTWCTWAARRSAAPALVMTEMVCVSPRGADHPGLRRDVRARARGGLAADHRRSCTSSPPRRSGCSSATPAARAPPG